jgi:5-methylcytosine-specific restriction endonuclease McrA
MIDCLPFRRHRGCCDACGAPLVGQARRWCRDGCDDVYWTNHRWPRARGAARRRADIGDGRYRCRRCGCGTRAPEVNHKTPALGAHAHESCAHHQENLEVLCHDCHQAETKRQRAAGELRRSA